MARNTWHQQNINPTVLATATKALNNRQMKKPACPMPDCEWQSYATPQTYSWQVAPHERALSRLKRHMREKHRAYYNLAMAKPFVIYEEEEELIHGTGR